MAQESARSGLVVIVMDTSIQDSGTARCGLSVISSFYLDSTSANWHDPNARTRCLLSPEGGSLMKILLVFLLTTPVLAFARLGETLQESIATYGKPSGYTADGKPYWAIDRWHVWENFDAAGRSNLIGYIRIDGRPITAVEAANIDKVNLPPSVVGHFSLTKRNVTGADGMESFNVWMSGDGQYIIEVGKTKRYDPPCYIRVLSVESARNYVPKLPYNQVPQ